MRGNTQIRIIRAAGPVTTLAMAGAILAGCGGAVPSDTPPAGAGTGDAVPATTVPEDPDPGTGGAGDGLCALVDASLAREALGGASVDAGSAKHGTVFEGDGCVYRAQDSADWVSIWVHQDLARDEWDATAKKTGVASGDAVDGLGEAAWPSVGSPPGPRLDAWSDGIGGSVAVTRKGIGTRDAGAPTRIIQGPLDRLG